jgi:hypothetical protein
MTGFLTLLLIAAPLLAQVSGDTRMHRGDDLRWADPAFDDRGWEIVGQRQVRPSADSAENRLWLRMRVTVPADPAVVLVYRCPCEVFLDNVRLGATGNLDLPRPDTTGELRVFPIPSTLAGRVAVLAVRQYHPPGIEASLGFVAWQRIRLTAVRNVGPVAEEVRQSTEFPYIFRLGFLLLALGGLLAAAAGQRRDPLVLGLFVYVFSQSSMSVLPLFMPLPYADNLAWIWLMGMGIIPALVFVQWQLAGLPVKRGWTIAALAVYLAFRGPWTAGLFLAKPAAWTLLAVGLFLVPSLVGLVMLGCAARDAWGRSGWPLRILLLAGPATAVLNLSTRLSAQGWIPSFTLPLGA